FSVGSVAAETLFYVSPTGNDAWSGTRAEASGSDGPFATLQKALDAAAGQEGARILLADGRHQLNAPVKIGGQHSGTASNPIHIAALPAARPILSGGRAITGWKRDEQNP